VISVAFKTPLEARLGSCIYKTSLLLHRPDDYIGFTFTPRCPPTFYNKIAPMPDITRCLASYLIGVNNFDTELLPSSQAQHSMLDMNNQWSKEQWIRNTTHKVKPHFCRLRQDSAFFRSLGQKCVKHRTQWNRLT